MSALVLGDADVERLPMARVLEVVSEVLRDSAKGRGDHPARQRLDWGDGDLVLTAARLPRARGFRAYETGHDRDQVVVAWDHEGRLSVIVEGTALGERRTGALGGLAVRHVARRGSDRLAVLGTGAQAWSQLTSIAHVLDLRELAVWSRTAASRESFAARAAAFLGPDVAVRAARHSAEAVEHADVVVTATSSPTPILRWDDLPPGVHVNAVGPKTTVAHELEPAVFELADVLVTDAPAQAVATEGLLPRTDRLVPLGRLVDVPDGGRRDAAQRSVYVSLGLSGTEVALALALKDARCAEDLRG